MIKIKKTVNILFIILFFGQFVQTNIFALGNEDASKKETQQEEENKSQKDAKAADEFVYLPVFINSSFNSKDIFISGGAGGYIFSKSGCMFSIRGNIDYRPYKKTTYVEKSTNHYYQLKESRYGASVVLDFIVYFYKNKDADFWSLGSFFAAGAGFTTGSYAGIDNLEAETKGSPVLRCGMQLGYRLYLRAGYQYFKVPNVPPNRLIVEIGYTF